MPRCFVDLTEDERFWNGEIAVRVEAADSLSGAHMALAIGTDVEIVLTISQCVTLFDVLDAWLNNGPVREVGGIRRRLFEAIRELVKDREIGTKKLFSNGYTQEAFVHELEEYIKLKGLRFRLHDEAADARGEQAGDLLHKRVSSLRTGREARAGGGSSPPEGEGA